METTSEIKKRLAPKMVQASLRLIGKIT